MTFRLSGPGSGPVPALRMEARWIGCSSPGDAPSSGRFAIAGAKNSALKLMAASLLADGRTTFHNVPRIQDCITMVEVLEHLGAGVAGTTARSCSTTRGVQPRETPYELVSRMRASILVLGPLLARFGRARVAMPGGCNIGSRQIDLHVRGLEKMGARFTSEHGFLVARRRRAARRRHHARLPERRRDRERC